LLLNDAELTVRAKAGDLQAFEQLVERHFGLVWTIALARLRNRETAEDLTQEVFLQLYLRIGSLRQGARFAPWAAQAARNLATDWERRAQTRSRLVTLVSTAEEMRSPAPGARDVLSRSESEQRLWKALDALNPDDREHVLLLYVNGMTKREIAERTGVHPSNVGRRIDKALEEIRAAMSAMPTSLPPSLVASSHSLARSARLIGAVAALSAAEKAALAASPLMRSTAAAFVYSSSTPSVTGLAHTLAAKAAGGSLMVKAGACVVLVAAVAAGVSLVDRNGVAQTVAPPAASITSGATVSLSPLPVGYTVSAKPSTKAGTKAAMRGNTFTAEGLTLAAAIKSGWPGKKYEGAPAAHPAIDFELVAPAGTSSDEMERVLQTELQRAFGVRITPVEKQTRCLVLRIAGAGTPAGIVPSQATRGMMNSSNGLFAVQGQPFSTFVRALEREEQIPVLDETGLTGKYDYRWTSPARASAAKDLGLQVQEEDRTIQVLQVTRTS